jgi:hypothetical protein
MDRVSNDLDIEMNYATTDEYVPQAEQNNQTIKERIRRKIPQHAIQMNPQSYD